MTRPRVFGIGLNKTGTTSLKLALKALGYHHFDRRPKAFRLYRRGAFDQLFEMIDDFESFEDWPWPLMVPDLLARYPDARFVLTKRRNATAWVESLKAHTLRTNPDNNPREAIFGHAYPHGQEDAHEAFYAAHLAQVEAAFAERPDQLLTVCWEAGDGWAELCDFLGHPVPNMPFPHANRSSDADIDPARKAENLRRIEALSR